MLRKKLRESLTVRIFLITLFILLCAGGVILGLMALAAPTVYTAIVSGDLDLQAKSLAAQLAHTDFEDCGSVIDEFIRSSGADALLIGRDGNAVDTGSRLSLEPEYGGVLKGEDFPLQESGIQPDSFVFQEGVAGSGNSTITVTMSYENAIVTDVRFANRDEAYSLYVIPRIKEENLAVRALVQMAPWLLFALLAFSVLCALVYSRYITRPILRLNAIAGKMAELDFHWECGRQRKDEIGTLGQSLDQMARRLSTALKDLEEANRGLQREVERERELERQRTAFFSAASHELKTPVTILKGQLAGMLEGVDIYKDRDKYLLRSLQVTGRMEKLIQEMLTISRMETGTAALRREPVDLSGLLEGILVLDSELIIQRGQHLVSQLAPSLAVTGDPSLLRKAIENLLSNASLYSPQGAVIRVWCGSVQGRPCFTVENSPAHIGADALPHIFEAFYRTEGSRSRETGGSGLGLYLAKMILERHNASCTIENTEGGVRAAVLFPLEG